MNPYELQRYISVYNNNPTLFDDDFVDDLEKSSKELGINFQRNMDAEESKQDNLLEQFVSGVSEGLTTLGWADEPTSESGQIVNSIGHLIGFAPAIISSAFTGGAAGLTRLGLGATKTASALGTTGRFLANAKSAPFFIADKINKPIYKGLTKAGINVDEYVKKGSATADVLMSAQNLGVASAVSSFWEGKDAIMDSYVHGAIAGGAFGTIGNFTNIGKMLGHSNPKVRSGAEEWVWNKVAQAGLGSAFQGGMATAQDAPTSVQIYEYLLGGFFGYKHPNAKIKAARQYTNAFSNSESEIYGNKFNRKEREMLNTEEFKALDPVSQEYVTDHFNSRIGQRFENYSPMNKESNQMELLFRSEADLTEASAYMNKQIFDNTVLKMNYESAKEKFKAERKRDLTETEDAVLKTEMMNEADVRYQDELKGALAGQVYEKILGNPDKLNKVSESVFNKLTKEQIESIRKSDNPLKDITEVLNGNKDLTMDLKEARDILNFGRSIEDQFEVDVPRNIKDMVLEIETKLKEDSSQLEIVQNIVDVYNSNVKDKGTYRDFINAVESKFPEYRASTTIRQDLKNLFNQISKNKRYPYIAFDLGNNNYNYRINHDSNGRHVNDQRPQTPMEMELKRRELGENPLDPSIKGKNETVFPNVEDFKFKTVEFKEIVVGGKIEDPYGSKWNDAIKDFSDIMTPERWREFDIRMDKDGMYSKIPKKDTGSEVIVPYHPYTDISKWNSFIKLMEKIDPRARKYFEEDYKSVNITQTKKDRELYQKKIMSNFLYEPNFQFKSAKDRVKRETLLQSQAIPSDVDVESFRDIMPDLKLNVVVASDNIKDSYFKSFVQGQKHGTFNVLDTNGKIKKLNYESEIDGWAVLPTQLYDRLLKAHGLHESTSRMKPEIAAYVNGQLFLLKGGIHPSHAEYDVALRNPNTMLVMTSSAKAVPKGTPIYSHHTKLNKKTNQFEFSLYEKNRLKKVKDPKTIQINLEDLRINYGVREDSHAIDPQTVKKQFHVLLNELQIPREAYDAFTEKVFAPNIEGNKVFNKYVKDLISDPLTEAPKRFKIGEIGDAEFTYIMSNNTHPLYKPLLKEMLRSKADKEYFDQFGSEQSLVQVDDYVNELQRLAKYMNYDPIVQFIKPELYNTMVMNYRKNKYMYPSWKYSAGAWVAGVDPISKAKYGEIKNGTFKAGHSLRDMNVSYDGIKDTTLGEVWKEYQSLLKAPKKDKKRIKIYEEALEMALMRVPSPAVSGTRILRFDGFIENERGRSDYGVYMHPKDHFYIDGADVDGDKVFVYQGMPKLFTDAVKKHANELNIPGTNATYENKARELDYFLGSPETPDYMKSPLSQIMPNALRKVGQASYKGKQGMGVIVNAKTLLNYITSDVIKKGGVYELDLMKEGKQYGILKLETTEDFLNNRIAYINTPMGKKNVNVSYRRLSVETSSRTADSSSYDQMMSPMELRNVLLESAFSKIEARNMKGKKINFKYEDIRNTEYEELININEKLYGYNYKKNRAWTLDEIQNAMEFHRPVEDRMNSLFYLSNQFAKNKIDQKFIKGNKAWRQLVNKVNKSWRDPNVMPYIIRKQLSVVPNYLIMEQRIVKARLRRFYAKKENKDLLDKGKLSIRDLRIQGLQGALDKRLQTLFNKMLKDNVIRPHEPLMEQKLIINDAHDIYSAVKVSEKGKALFDELVNKGAMGEADAIEYLTQLANNAIETKIYYRNARAGNKERFIPTKYSMDDVNRSMKSDKRRIVKQAKDLNIDSQKALDYYYYYMASSLYPQPYGPVKSKVLINRGIKKELEKSNPDKDWVQYYKDKLKPENWSKFYNKTSINKFPMETSEMPERIKKDWLGGFAKMFNTMRPLESTPKKVIRKAEDSFPETPSEPITKTQKVSTNNMVLEKFFDPVFKKDSQGQPINYERLNEANIPKDIPKVVERLKEHYASLPKEAIERIEDHFAAFKDQKDMVATRISEMTWEDIRGFERFIRNMRVQSAEMPNVRKLYYYLFPERLGEKQVKYDLGQIYKTKLIYKGKEGVGEVNVRVPMSSFGYLSKAFGNVYAYENIDREIEQESLQRTYEWRDQILGMENGTTEFAKLHRAALAKRLNDHKPTSLEDKETKSYYEKLWDQNKGFYDEIALKNYKIKEKGQIVNKSGKEVMEWLMEKHTNYLKEFYDKWIKTPTDWTWMEIDSRHIYGKKDNLVEFNQYGRMNIEKLQRLVVDRLGQGNSIERLVKNTSLSVDLLNRLQYETVVERAVLERNLKPNSNDAKRFREWMRQPKVKNAVTNEEVENKRAYKSIGRVKEEFYWPQMMHRATRSSRREVQKYIDDQLIKLQQEAMILAEDILQNKKNVKAPVEEKNYKIKTKYLASKSTEEAILELWRGKITKEEFAERLQAQMEVDFEKYLVGKAVEDGGSSESAMNFVLQNVKNTATLNDLGFNSRPGTGRARSEDSPMPGFSLDFEVVGKYSEQWISSFYKNMTSLIADKTIKSFEQNNKKYDKDSLVEWSDMMKMYTRDVLGHSSAFTPELMALNSYQRRIHEARIKRFKSLPSDIYKELSAEEVKNFEHSKSVIRRDNQLKNFRRTAYYYLSDEMVAGGLDRLANGLGKVKGVFKKGKKGERWLPIVGELPRSPEARKRVLVNVASNIGAFEAKWSLISLLSHPKTAVGNLLGGNVNTISQTGLRNFIRTKDKAYMYNIFKGGRLKDKTEITPDNVDMWLGRFAEESGALESFIVDEASLERGFRSAKAKNFLKDAVDEIRKDYSMPDNSLMDIAKKHGITKTFVDGGAWFMRKSERMLRKDSFYSHYLNSHEILSQIVPDLKYDNPYLIKMAQEGVKATQFLYHSSARPAFSRTVAGRALTRFMPFAWNSIRFRRMAFQKASVHGFDMNTVPGKRLQRILMLDAFAFALANIYVSSIFDSALPPPMSYMQDTADWLFGDEKTRERAFFNQWPHPALAPLSTITGPSMRFILGPTKALINNEWEPFVDYQLWTWAPFGRLARSLARTYENPEMWVEEMSGIPIHRIAQKKKKAEKERLEAQEVEDEYTE